MFYCDNKRKWIPGLEETGVASGASVLTEGS